MDIQKLTVVVTGGASGMGEASARHLAKLGAKVCILDRNIDAAHKVAAEIHASAFAADVSDAKSVESAFEQIKAKHGTIRVLVNCAGVAPAARVVGKKGAMPLDAFAQTIQINLIGSFNTLRIAAEQMSIAEPLNADGERGLIINTASVAAFEGQIGQAAYSASKGGIVSMTLPIARELSRFGIRVMTIAPGLIATPMLLGMPDEVQQSLAAQVPFPKRLGLPEEYAKLVEHIIENPMLNGSVIRLDGAIRMAAS